MRLPFRITREAASAPSWALGTGFPIRVMLIDDDDEQAMLTRSLLARVDDVRYEMDWVATFNEGLASIARDEHHAYLVDHQLGGRTGVELVKEAREAGSFAALIMMTGQRDRATDIAAMEAGATDFLLKGRTDHALLDRTLRYSISQAAMVSALDRSRNQMAGLEEIGRILVDDGPTEATVERVVDLIVDRFALRQVAIYLADGGSLYLAGQRGYEHPVTFLSRDDSSVDRVANAGKPIFVPSFNPGAGVPSSGNEVATELSVPLIVAGELVGLLNVPSLVNDPLGQDDYAAIRLVGDRLTAALDLLRERRVADERLSKVRQQLSSTHALSGTDGLFDGASRAYRRPLLVPLLEVAIASAATAGERNVGLLLVAWREAGPDAVTRVADQARMAFVNRPTVRFAESMLAVLFLGKDEESARAEAARLVAHALETGSEVRIGYAALTPRMGANELIAASEAALALAQPVGSETTIG
jgi:DNA-binding response OmpR family regulator